MALQVASVLYPLKSAVVDSGGTVNIYNLSDTEPGATDNTTSISNTTKNTAVERTFSPGVGANTDANNAQTAQNGHGWAVPVADMVVDAACSVYLVAQTVTVNFTGFCSGTGTGTGNDTFIPKASLWKWDPVANTATQITGTFGATITKGSTGGAYTSAFTASVALPIPSTTTFAAGELLFVVIGARITTSPATLTHSCSMQISLDVSTTNLTFSVAGLQQACSGSGSISGTAACTGTGYKGGVGSATLVGTPVVTVSGKKGGVGSSVIAASAAITVSGKKAAFGSSVIAATGAIVVTGRKGTTGNGTIAGTPALITSGHKGGLGSSTITGVTGLTGVGVAGRRGSGVIPATPLCGGSGQKSGAGSGSINATVAVTGVGLTARYGNGTITGTAFITGDGTMQLPVVPTQALTGTISTVALVGDDSQPGLIGVITPNAMTGDAASVTIVGVIDANELDGSVSDL